MLPSKGFFKSLNCLYFQNGFCDRPHCHFLHAKRDKTVANIADENQTSNVDTSIPKEEKEILAISQVASVSYKPTPIAELEKRHLPVITAPTANSSIKQRMEYNVRKPKIEYMPKVSSYGSYSDVESYPAPVSNTVHQVYKATRISEQKRNKSEVFLTDSLQGSSADDDIDLEQVSSEFNFLGQFQEEYESEDGTNTNINNNNTQVNKDNSTRQCNRETVCALTKLNNTTNKENTSTPHVTGKITSDDKKFVDNLRNKENGIAIPKCNTFGLDKIKKNEHSNKSCSTVSSNKKRDHKKDQHHHSRPESDKHKLKQPKDSSTCKSKNKKHKKENNINLCKTNLNESEKSKEKSSSTRHKSTSSKPLKSESENKSSSHKSSKKDKEHQGSSRSESKEDHGNNNSKSWSKHKLDKKKTNGSSSRNSEKDESKRKTNLTESKKRDKDIHTKEKPDKNKEKYRDEKRKRESEECETTDGRHHLKKQRLSNESNDCNYVEVISDSDSVIIIIDSDDDSNKNIKRKRKISNRIDRVSLSPEFNWFARLPSDSDSDATNSDFEADMEVELSSKNAPTQAKQDDTFLVDHRVMSRMKNRVSMGSTWRPPPRKRVEPMTPAQRMQVFRKQLQDQEEKEKEAPSVRTRVRIGCSINVKGLLEEKRRLLQINDGQRRTIVGGASTARSVCDTAQPNAQISTTTPEAS